VLCEYQAALCLSGHLLDSFARSALWDSGLDYLHGTGHGVGSFLNVHEGPCGISYKTFSDEPLEAGMIVTDGRCPLAEGRGQFFVVYNFSVILKEIGNNFPLLSF
jgi:Xaa-Pro aminopeptidase